MRDGASLYLSVCVAATCIPEFCIHDMLFTITGKLAHDGTGEGERSLEAIEYKYNKNELLFISVLQVASLQLQKWNEATKNRGF